MGVSQLNSRSSSAEDPLKNCLVDSRKGKCKPIPAHQLFKSHSHSEDSKALVAGEDEHELLGSSD
jgi:hypothetical protein